MLKIWVLYFLVAFGIVATAQQPKATECPKLEIVPPRFIAATDFVEMSRTGCLGTCPSYTVRVSANGDVLWTGQQYVKSKGTKHASMDLAQARDLIAKFQTKEFWGLCKSYSIDFTDNSTTNLRAAIGADSKEVSNYAGSAPAWVGKLELALDEVANTHLWRHGDPKTEALVFIRDDLYLTKPGVTPLMRAAGRGDNREIERLLDSGARASGADSSGWTPLMYAAANGQWFNVQQLVKAGADPNQSSINGDTALMASAYAFRGGTSEDLLKAGAKVNAQNAEGTTALMILASRAMATEVSRALKAGADPSMKDNFGRTAMDYLKLAHCGKSPLREETVEVTWMGDQACNYIEADPFIETRDLLTKPLQKQGQ